jgi:hypothetical protein
VIATACTVETIVEDPLLSILEEDSNITKSTGQIRRPGLDHNPTSPRFKLLMIDSVPYPKVGVFFNVRLYFRRTLCPFLRKKFVQSFFSWGKYISFTSFPQAEFSRRNNQSFPISDLRFPIPPPLNPLLSKEGI